MNEDDWLAMTLAELRVEALELSRKLQKLQRLIFILENDPSLPELDGLPRTTPETTLHSVSEVPSA